MQWQAPHRGALLRARKTWREMLLTNNNNNSSTNNISFWVRRCNSQARGLNLLLRMPHTSTIINSNTAPAWKKALPCMPLPPPLQVATAIAR
eukprot:m.112127 g.112127  ORF g.112127 m.112127 type:complete len:92 (-) comp14366_c5_seq1:1478-1753(-)